MSNKIGILTFHNAINYGAVLQSYALEKYLEIQGVNSEIINYKNPKICGDPSLKKIWSGEKWVFIIYNTLKYPFYRLKVKKFRAFLDQINISRVNDLQNVSDYSKIIIGSDQVWNLEMTGEDYTYFLKNIKGIKKYSYASSFGEENIFERYKDEIKSCLSDFEMISVRENTAKDFIEDVLKDVTVDCVLDPTFLFSRKYWEGILNPPKYEKKYVLVYQIAYSKELIDSVKKYAQKNHLSIVVLNGNPRQIMMGKYVLAAGPSDWLGWIRNAEIIFTNSFHGTVYSIIFEKNFYTCLLTAQAGRNDRIITLLKALGLEKQIINGVVEECYIDYIKVKKSLDVLIEKSKKYISRIIKDE